MGQKNAHFAHFEETHPFRDQQITLERLVKKIEHTDLLMQLDTFTCYVSAAIAGSISAGIYLSFADESSIQLFTFDALLFALTLMLAVLVSAFKQLTSHHETKDEKIKELRSILSANSFEDMFGELALDTDDPTEELVDKIYEIIKKDNS